MTYAPHMMEKVRSDDIMAGAAGSPCTLRVSSLYPGHRCSGDDTVVNCHLPVIGKGVSTKVTDMAAAFGCFHCHQILDGVDRQRREYIETRFPTLYVMRMLNGLVETHALLIAQEIITIKGATFE